MDKKLLDEEALRAWLLDTELLSQAAINSVSFEKLSGGRSNEMYTVSTDQNQWVLRRPAGVAWEKAESVLMREHHLLSTLASLSGGSLAIPRTIAKCEDRSVLGAAFYLMEKVDGFMPAMEFPPEFTENQPVRNETAFAGLNAIAAIHNVDWQAAGLEEFGKPDQFHERQVERWLSQFDSYQGREMPGLRDLGSWLEANLPSQWAPTIMHGDYHPLNILMAPTVSPGVAPNIAAIVDWETATIGDPFLDVVGYLDVWFDANGAYQWPSYDELVEHYLSQVGFVPENMNYYRVLYYFRMAVLLEGIYQRSLLDDTRETNLGMKERAELMVERAAAILCQ